MHTSSSTTIISKCVLPGVPNTIQIVQSHNHTNVRIHIYTEINLLSFSQWIIKPYIVQVQ